MTAHTINVENRKVCVVGLGYIGLPTAALLANTGFEVLGVDVAQKVVETINKGNIHIVEPDLDRYVSDAVARGTLKCSTEPEAADVYIIAVPTPFHEGHVPNIEYVKAATKSIAPFVAPGNIVILESTSPVGTTDTINDLLKENGVNTEDLLVAHCPERVLPGHIMQELVENDRIVGGINEESTKAAADFYRSFVKGAVLETDSKTAELAKLTENSFRDVNIAFANELSILCDKFGINVWETIRLANHHPRVNILNPGVGVGGHCIAVDPWFIIHSGQEDARLMRTAREVNLAKTEWVVEQIKSQAAGLEEKTKNKPVIACLGLAYKPNIDDLRESPSLEIATRLKEGDYETIFVEPNLDSHDELELEDYQDALHRADIIAVLVGHKEFDNIATASSAAGKLLLDYCGITE